MKLEQMRVTFAALAALTVVVAASTVAQADPGPGPGDPSTGMVLVLLDRSGSMVDLGKNCLNPDGSTETTPIRKWQCAVRAGNFRISQTDSAASRRYFVWAFARMADGSTDGQTMWSIDKNGHPVKDLSGKVAPADVTDALALSQADAIGALNALDPLGPQVDDASTPLAGAYCAAISKLSAYRDTKKRYQLTLTLESDGLENSTAGDVQCHGTNSFDSGHYFTPAADPIKVDLVLSTTNPAYIATADGLMVPSWQSHMLDMSATGVFHGEDATGVTYASGAFRNPPTATTAFLTNIDFISTFIPSAVAARSASVDTANTDGGSSRALISSAATTDPGLSFLIGMAQVTGGRVMSFGSGEAPVPGDPTAPHLVPGDVDNSGCVDLVDFNILKQFYNQKVSAAQPMSYAADINNDAQIDFSDFLMMKAHFGEGCAVSPGPIPVLAQAILGFDSLTSWSSAQAPLSLVAIPRTEGSFAVSVGKTGFRTLSSIQIPTDSLQGVTSTLALDVALPATVSNRYWLGQVLMFVNCPSAGVYNQFIGAVELAGKPLDAFSTVNFTVPTSVKDALLGSHSDLSFSISLNANDPGYLFDNLRFVP